MTKHRRGLAAAIGLGGVFRKSINVSLFWAVLALVTLSARPASADILRQLNLSGRLTTTSGANVDNGQYQITFRIYTTATGGSPIWEETQTVTVTSGVWSVLLGPTTALPGNVDFNSNALYVAFKVGNDSEMSPRKRIAATAMAFNADTLDGLHAASSAGANQVLATDSSGNVALSSGRLSLTNDVAADVPLSITGAASQSGKYLQIQNSAGSEIFSIASSGQVNTSGSIIPSASGLNLGSATNKFATGYFDNLSVATTDTSGTTSAAFAINTDQTTNNTENEQLRFYLGPTLNTYATLQWDATNNRFNLFSREGTSTYGTVRANVLELQGTSNQLVMQAGGVTGTLSWTPTTTNKTITLPDATTTLVGTDTTQTLTSKTLTDPTIQGTVGAGTGLTLPAFTAGGTISASSGLTIRPLTADLAAGDALTMNTASGIELTAASGTQNWLNIAPLINQSGTAGYTALLVNATQTAIGSSTKRLIDAQVGGTSRFNINNAGVAQFSEDLSTNIYVQINPDVDTDSHLIWRGLTNNTMYFGAFNTANSRQDSTLTIWGSGGVNVLSLQGVSNNQGIISASILDLRGTGATGVRINPSALSSGSPTLFSIVGPAHTSLAADTEASDMNINLARTVQFTAGGGTFTNQRAVLIQAPTYSATAAETITNATTLAITGAPVASTNATLTNSAALRIASNAVGAGVTNAYGFYVDAPTGGGANYAATFATGNVGIGTTGPGFRLQVTADATGSFDTNGQLAITGSTSTARRLVLGYDTTGNYGVIQASEQGVSWRDLVLQPDAQSGAGRLGVGTSTFASNSLAIFRAPAGFGSNTYVYIDRVGTSNEAMLTYANAATAQWYVGLRSASPTDAYQIYSAGPAATILSLAYATGNLTLQPAVATSGSPALVTLTGPAHTSLAADTEASDMNLNLARTVQFTAGGGTFSTQRAVRIQAPTYSATAAETITDSATLAISGAPAQGTNMTLTNSYALWSQAGDVRFDQGASDNLIIDAAATDKTSTAGAIDLDIDSSTTSVSGIDVNIENTSTATTGTVTVSGLSVSPVQSGAGAGGTHEVVGAYVQAASGTAGAGTQNQYGVRIANQGLASTETAYGLYIDAQSGSTSNYELIVSGDALVGIGTTAPKRPLTIGYTAAFGANIAYEPPSGQGSGWAAYLNSTGDYTLHQYSAADFSTGDDRFIIKRGGSVGIGDMSPAEMLTVGNTDRFTVTSTGITSVNLNSTATIAGMCHSGADVDVATDSTRTLVPCSAAPDDYAEWHETQSNVDHGEVVVITDQTFSYEATQSDPFTGLLKDEKVKRSLPVLAKSSSAYSDQVLGVISTSPIQTIGSDVKHQGQHPMPLALSGRVPVKVTTHNGQDPIRRGDLLTASEIPGLAMRYDAAKVPSATLRVGIIGLALGDWPTPEVSSPTLGVNGAANGTIMMMVRNFVIERPISELVQGSSQMFNQLLITNVQYGSSTLSIADSGGAGAAAGTLTPSSSHAEVTCNDVDGCTLAISEVGARQGQRLTIINVSANTLTIKDTTGQQETTTPALGQYDTVELVYIADRWVQTGTSNN